MSKFAEMLGGLKKKGVPAVMLAQVAQMDPSQDFKSAARLQIWLRLAESDPADIDDAAASVALINDDATLSADASAARVVHNVLTAGSRTSKVHVQAVLKLDGSNIYVHAAIPTAGRRAVTGIVGLPSLTIDLGIGYGPNDVAPAPSYGPPSPPTSASWTACPGNEDGHPNVTPCPPGAHRSPSTRGHSIPRSGPPPTSAPRCVSATPAPPSGPAPIDQWDGTWTGGLKPVTRVSPLNCCPVQRCGSCPPLPVEAQKAKGPAALFPLDEASSSSLASIIPQNHRSRWASDRVCHGRHYRHRHLGRRILTGVSGERCRVHRGVVLRRPHQLPAVFIADRPHPPGGDRCDRGSNAAARPWPASTCWPVALQGRDSDDFAFALGLTSAGVPTVDWLAGGSAAGSISGGSGMSLTTWTHVAVTVTAGGSARLYV